LIVLATALPAQQRPEAPPSPEASAAHPEAAKRVELNLLGKTDAGAGESRRNENVQFNLVDNNVLKELNVRLGAVATIVEEFRPERSYFGAEFGQPPSAVLHAVPLRPAGFHGGLWYGHLNSVFSARSFFQVGDVKPARENRYGFSLELPAWRSGRWSVDGSQEKLRGSVNGNVLVPRPDERTPRTPDPEKRALIARWLAAYPAELPNRTDINPRALNTNSPQAIDNQDAGVRLDQAAGRRDRLVFDYRFLAQSVDAFQFVAGQNPDTDTKSHRARVTWNRAWSAATVSDFSLGFDRLASLLAPEENAVGPMVAISGLTTLGPAGEIPIDRAQNQFRAAGHLRKISAAHSWTAGFDLTRRQINGYETDAHRGYFSFSNDYGRSGIENLLWGTPSQHIVSIGHVHRGYRQWRAKLYAGDEWKLGPKLDLRLGLRYEPVTRPVEVNRIDRVPYDSDWNNLAPQFGFAYRVSDVWGAVRGAYGLHYGDIFPVTFGQIRFSPPGSVKYAVPAPDLLHPLASAGHALGNLYLLDPELALPYSHQYNFRWEPGWFGAWKLQLGWAGSRSHKLLIMWYLNRAHPVDGIPQTTATINQRRTIPNLAEIRWVLNGSRGYYDAARVSLIAPRWKGFTIDAAYWFSKALDLGADYTNTAAGADSRLSRSQWEFETHRDRKGLSNFDQPHAFLLRTSYEVAGGAVRRAGRLLGGWRLTAAVLLKKGTPFTVTTLDGPGFGNVDGNGGDRPNLLDPSILGRTIGHPDTSVKLLPASAFAFIAPTDRGGNLGVNTFRKGGIRNVNASLAKSWTMNSHLKLTVRGESINLLNTPQFAEPGSQLGTPEFAHITNTLNDGRTFRFLMQLGW
jgi:hypothetical protein